MVSLNQLPLWLLASLLVMFFLAALETGYFAGLRKHRIRDDFEKSARGDVTLGSMLALLGLMLAFTYSFSMSRSDHRKEAVIAESNAISTAFLRADLTMEPGRSELRELLLEYARTRIVTAEMVKTPEQLQMVLARSLEAQSALWPTTKRALQGNVPGHLQASFVQAVNEVLDAHTKRFAAFHDRLPDAILMLLSIIAVVSVTVAGYQAGLSGNMNHWRRGAFVLILAALILIIIDLDRPLEGLIQVNQESITSLVRDMERAIAD
jgi:hypothetical protein